MSRVLALHHLCKLHSTAWWWWVLESAASLMSCICHPSCDGTRVCLFAAIWTTTTKAAHLELTMCRRSAGWRPPAPFRGTSRLAVACCNRTLMHLLFSSAFDVAIDCPPTANEARPRHLRCGSCHDRLTHARPRLADLPEGVANNAATAMLLSRDRKGIDVGVAQNMMESAEKVTKSMSAEPL